MATSPDRRPGAAERLRVLHVTASDQRRGAEVFAADLAGRMDDVEQLVLHLRAVAGSRVMFPCPARHLAAGEGPLGLVGAALRARTEASVFRPNLVQAHGGEALRLAVLAGLGRRTPVVYRRIGMAQPSMRGGWRRRWHRQMMRQAALVVCVSDLVRTETVDVFDLDPERTVTVPNAVDPQRLEPGDRARPEARAALGVGEDGRVVLSVGALSWEKDPLGMLDVTSELLRADGRNRHVFVGDGPLRSRLEERATALGVAGQVVLTGARNDVGAVLAASDVVLFASRTEGMPATLIEAGLAARPAVAMAVGGVSEVVVDGQTGVVVARGDRAGLRAAVAALLDDPARRRALGEAAAARCWARFTIDVVAPEYRRLWELVAAGGG